MKIHYLDRTLNIQARKCWFLHLKIHAVFHKRKQIAKRKMCRFSNFLSCNHVFDKSFGDCTTSAEKSTFYHSWQNYNFATALCKVDLFTRHFSDEWRVFLSLIVLLFVTSVEKWLLFNTSAEMWLFFNAPFEPLIVSKASTLTKFRTLTTKPKTQKTLETVENLLHKQLFRLNNDTH